MSIEVQTTKTVGVIDPGVIVDNASYTTNEVDTLGFDYAQVIVYIGGTDVAMAALKVQESSTSGSGFTDVTGLTFGTSTNTDGAVSALPSALDDGNLFVMDVDLRGRERYLDLVATAGNGTAGTYATAWCVLSRAGETPMSATERGAAEVLRV